MREAARNASAMEPCAPGRCPCTPASTCGPDAKRGSLARPTHGQRYRDPARVPPECRSSSARSPGWGPPRAAPVRCPSVRPRCGSRRTVDLSRPFPRPAPRWERRPPSDDRPLLGPPPTGGGAPGERARPVLGAPRPATLGGRSAPPGVRGSPSPRDTVSARHRPRDASRPRDPSRRSREVQPCRHSAIVPLSRAGPVRCSSLSSP